VDETKDQSYFLAGLSREQLEYAEFPVGGMRKSDLRDLARKIKLPNAERPDSQGLCFIGKVNIREFLARHIELHPGDIVDTSGRVLGRHEGIEIYTLGQRKGIGVGGGPARFVVAKDMTTHTLVVGDENDPALLSGSCRVERWRWIESPRTGTWHAGVKIRYRQPDQSAEAEIAADGTGLIRFDAPQRAVTPGQVAVAYDGDRVVGSGEIVADPT
jgi:tRNA-uridine 2-sulfurtransferase